MVADEMAHVATATTRCERLRQDLIRTWNSISMPVILHDTKPTSEASRLA